MSTLNRILAAMAYHSPIDVLMVPEPLRPQYTMLRAAKSMEHRWGQRVRVDLPINIGCSPNPLSRGRLRDISVSGAFAYTDLRLPILSRIRLKIGVPGRAGCLGLCLPACVVRTTPSGFGLEWQDFAPELIKELFEIAGVSGAVSEPMYGRPDTRNDRSHDRR